MHLSIHRQNKEIDLASDLKELYASIKQEESRFPSLLEKVHFSQRTSATNLLHYLSLRSKDLESLQTSLHLQGFSTLSSSEGYVESQLLAVLQHFGFNSDGEVPCDFFSAQKILQERVSALFDRSH